MDYTRLTPNQLSPSQQKEREVQIAIDRRVEEAIEQAHRKQIHVVKKSTKEAAP